MSRGHCSQRRDRVRFPRVSGDEPFGPLDVVDGVPFSPRERG